MEQRQEYTLSLCMAGAGAVQACTCACTLAGWTQVMALLTAGKKRGLARW